MILFGDFNVHWQEYLASAHTSAAGRFLQEVFELNGLA